MVQMSPPIDCVKPSKVYNILVLGAGNGGKSTLIKHVRKLHCTKDSTYKKEYYDEDSADTIREALYGAMHKLLTRAIDKKNDPDLSAT